MYKLVPLSEVGYDYVFYMPDLLNKEVMTNNSYKKIFFMHYGCSKLYTSVALCQAVHDTAYTETECPTLFDINEMVYIKVPGPKYKDINYNERFKCMNNQYLKIDTNYHSKPLTIAIHLDSGTIVDFSGNEEVERV